MAEPSAHRGHRRSRGLLVAAAVVAVSTSVGVLAIHRAPHRTGIPTDGPLVARSESWGGQDRTHTTLPIFLGGTTGIANLDHHPVTVVSATTWAGDHLSIHEVAYLALPRGGERHLGGFVGQTGQLTVRASGLMRPGEPQWAGTRSLIGARIQPCCRQSYLLGLAYTPDLRAPIGRAAGVILTYRISTGRLYRAYVTGECGFCTGDIKDPQCLHEADLEDDQNTAASAHDAPGARMHAAGSWHG